MFPPLPWGIRVSGYHCVCHLLHIRKMCHSLPVGPCRGAPEGGRCKSCTSSTSLRRTFWFVAVSLSRWCRSLSRYRRLCQWWCVRGAAAAAGSFVRLVPAVLSLRRFVAYDLQDVPPWGGIGWLRPLLFKGREMPAHSQAGGPTLHIVAPAFLRIGTGSGPAHHSLSPKPIPECGD